MPRSSAGFIGARVLEAREARGVTAVALSGKVGVSASIISQYERGTKAPQPEVLERIAEAVNLPLRFFLEPAKVTPDRNLFFRSQSAATKSARLKESRRFDWHVEIVGLLRTFELLPRLNFPEWKFDSVSGFRDEYIDALATKLRDFLGVGDGPIADLVELLEANGVIVIRCLLGADSLDAYSGWVGETPHIVLGANKASAVRSRFDAAHELGHLVMHGYIPPEQARRPEILKEMERQAHFFASSFLLPARNFCDDFSIATLDGFLSMKAKWKVAVAAMIKRASWLHLISQEQEQRLWIARGRRGWTTREPYDEVLMAETPHLLRAAFDSIRRSRRLTSGMVRALLPYADADIEQLASLPSGYLENMRVDSLRSTGTISELLPHPGEDTY